MTLMVVHEFGSDGRIYYFLCTESTMGIGVSTIGRIEVSSRRVD